MGAWVNLNEEAIYGSKPWKVYGDNLNSILRELRKKQNPTETDMEALKKLEGGKNEQFNERTVSSLRYGSDEVRFTTVGDNLYIFVLAPKAGEIELPTLGLKSAYNSSKIKSIEMLGGKEEITFTQTNKSLRFTVPAERPNRHATVFKVVFE